MPLAVVGRQRQCDPLCCRGLDHQQGGRIVLGRVDHKLLQQLAAPGGQLGGGGACRWLGACSRGWLSLRDGGQGEVIGWFGQGVGGQGPPFGKELVLLGQHQTGGFGLRLFSRNRVGGQQQAGEKFRIR